MLGYSGWGPIWTFIFIWEPEIFHLCLTVSSQVSLFSMTAEKVQMIDRQMDRWIDTRILRWVDGQIDGITHGGRRTDQRYAEEVGNQLFFKPL